MLEKPDIQDDTLTSLLQQSYGLTATQLEFLPLGADASAAVYRAVTEGGTAYFVKLRRGSADTVSISLLRFLSDQNVKHVISPLATKQGEFWTYLGVYTVTLFPFISGENGYAVPLTEGNWREFGRTIKGLHTLTIPSRFTEHLRYETYDASTRETVKALLTHLEPTLPQDPIAKRTARFILEKKADILKLVEDAERFAQDLQRQALEPVLCHDDLHAGNLLIESEQGFYIVDWDDPILAPKERDLMFIGGGLGFKGFTPEDEEALFYQGYGHTAINPIALAYYRLERILRDIAAFWDEIMNQSGSEEDRKASLYYLKLNFEPGSTIERAYAVTSVVPLP